MKKIYMTLAAAAVTFGVAAQQQLPNAGFEDGWGDCTPWTSSKNTKTKGTTPGDWTISQVIGINGPGATIVGEVTEGYNSEKAVKIYNNKNSIASNIVPGYVTLGTTWSTAVGTSAKNADGGTWGGISFTDRPESITFMYKRTHDIEFDNDLSEPATVVAYLWKGTFKQANVPGNIALGSIFGNPTTCTMENRDRNILDMSTPQGGVVTEKGTLIAKINYQIKGDAEDWTELTIPFEYLTDDTPEMINVIFSAGDYWSTTPLRGNTLIVDDVKLNYATTPDNPTPAEGIVSTYKGKLVIEMGEILNPDDDTDYTLTITELGNNLCNLKLADFELAGVAKFGDIDINGVKMTEDADGIHFVGSTDNLKLVPEGGKDEDAIYADVSCDGTDKDGKLDMTIVVGWKMGYTPAAEISTLSDDYTVIPINVTFNGQKVTSGVNAIAVDDNDAPVEYYNLNGQRVINPTGLVIRRQGSKATKVIIK
ncbi:MAG: PCMD domain-containing protein [Duncaniella sp.]|nr:PCMD domain-containing protein [Duncaniella sp.]